MKKKILSIFICVCSVYPLLSYANESRNKQCHDIIMTETHPKRSYPIKATICGTSCDDLIGTVVPVGFDHVYYKGPYYCFPYVENVMDYIKAGELEYIEELTDIIHIKNAPLLYPSGLSIRAEKTKEEMAVNFKQRAEEIGWGIPSEARYLIKGGGASGNYVRVRAIYDCDSKELMPEDPIAQQYVFCMKNDTIHGNPEHINEDYMVVCWDCERLKSSPQTLQSSMLFITNNYIALDGGYAVPFRFLKNFDAKGTRLQSRSERFNHFYKGD